MAVKLDVTSLRAEHADKTPRRPNLPKELKDVAAAHAAKNPKDLEDLGFVGVTFVEKGSLPSVKQYAADLQDAGNAIAVAKNASMYQAGFSYHSGRRKEAWLTEQPKDGKLQLQVVVTPSWHVSDYAEPRLEAPKDDAPQKEWDAYQAAWTPFEKSCEKHATDFALTNSYNVTVTYPDGTVDAKKFKVGGEKPEFSSASPEIEIDLKKHKGDIIIRGWADGSAGADGYAAARVTVLHNP